MIFLSVEEVIQVHDDLVSEYGGLHGIRDLGLLISAIEMPKATMFGEYLHESVFDKASKRAPIEYWIWDGIHPTVPGHELMAREWIRRVSTRLKFLRIYKSC